MRYTALDSWSEGQKTILRFFQVSFSLLSVVSCQNWPFNWSQISIAIQLVPKEMSTCLCSGRPGSLLAAYQPLPWSGNSYTKQRKSLEWGPWWLQVSQRRLNKRLVHCCFRFCKRNNNKISQNWIIITSAPGTQTMLFSVGQRSVLQSTLTVVGFFTGLMDAKWQMSLW